MKNISYSLLCIVNELVALGYIDKGVLPTVHYENLKWK